MTGMGTLLKVCLKLRLIEKIRGFNNVLNSFKNVDVAPEIYWMLV